MSTPILHKVADRSYTIESDVGDAIQFLNHIFDHIGQGKATDLFWHRWRHDGPQGRTIIVLFRGDPPRLSVLGPCLDEVDALAVEEVEL